MNKHFLVIMGGKEEYEQKTTKISKWNTEYVPMWEKKDYMYFKWEYKWDMTQVFKHCNNLFKNRTNRKVLIYKGRMTRNYSYSLYSLHHKGSPGRWTLALFFELFWGKILPMFTFFSNKWKIQIILIHICSAYWKY